MKIFIGMLLFLVGIVDGWGHLPEEQVYKVFQFPDNLVPQIDGDLRDWGSVNESYHITMDDMSDLVTDQPVDRADFDARVTIGWNKTLNRLYIAAQVDDDLHQIDRPVGSAGLLIWQDDDFEIFLDADHSGGQYADFSDLSAEEQLQLNGAEANHFVLAAPPPDEDFFINFSGAAWYALEDGLYTAAAYQLGEDTGQSSVISYEIMLVPFDKIDIGAAFLSREHRLEEGQILGLNIEFNDFDLVSTLFDAKLSLSGGQNAFKFSHRFADVQLMPFEEIFRPTSVNKISWGRIKDSFNSN
jgi:hypothetical protein